MDLKGIISISGKAGLYKVIAQAKNNIIVESIEDKKRIPAYSSDRISSLEDISIYTVNEDVALVDVFTKIYEKESGKTCISHKEDKNKLAGYLSDILPDYDTERVYVSDIKKIFQWYNILHKANLLVIEDKKEEKTPKKSSSKKEETKEATEKVKESKPKAASTKAKSPTKPKADKTTTKSAKTTGPKKVAAVKTGGVRGK